MRNLKALGLALMAMFAMSAVAASGASAQETNFTAAGGNYPQHLTTEDSGAADAFTVGSSTLTCSAETFTAEAKSATTTLTFDPDYQSCKTSTSGFNNVTVTDNGCTFTFTSHGHVTVNCGSKPIEIHHYSNEAHTNTTCTNTVGSQTAGGPTVVYTNNKNGTVTATGTPTVSLETHGACSFGFTTKQTSTYHLSTTVKGQEAIHVK